MKITSNVLLINQSSEVNIEHNNDKVSFSISFFGKEPFSNIDLDVFEHINKFWDFLPMEEQNAIFKIYKDIQFGFDNITRKTELFDYLSDKCVELLQLNNLQKIHDWLIFNSNVLIYVPDTCPTSYEYSIDKNNSREKTYTKADYINLAVLSLCLKIFVPIWGEYISAVRKETGKRFKEQDSFRLLYKTGLIDSIPVQKLKTYIDHIVGDDKYDPNITLNSISSEDFGYWLLCLVCIKKLSIGDIAGTDPRSNLMSMIYKFLLQKIRGKDSNYENIVKEKKFDEQVGDAENKTSSLERYKIKSNISLGEIVELDFSLSDIEKTAYRLCNHLSPVFLNRSLTSSSLLINERILDPQMTLLRWVFKPVISPRGLMYLSENIIIKALGVLEAVLWARGHKYLAILATSHAVMSDKEFIVSPVDSKSRISPELMDKINILYPYTRPASNRKSETNLQNLVLESIDNLTKSLTMFSWKPTADDSMLMEVFGSNSRRFPIKRDIKTDIANLVIELGSNSWI